MEEEEMMKNIYRNPSEGVQALRKHHYETERIVELMEEGLDLKEASELYEMGYTEEEVYMFLKCEANPEYAKGLGEELGG